MPIPEVPSASSPQIQDTDRLRRAIALAAFAHKGQLDKNGEPYLWHVLRVGISLLPDVNAAVVGILHDVLEDTFIDASVIDEKFGPECMAAVQALTHKKGEWYADYIHRITKNPLATKVKIADCVDNSRADRLCQLPLDVANRLLNKYSTALKMLRTAETARDFNQYDAITKE